MCPVPRSRWAQTVPSDTRRPASWRYRCLLWTRGLQKETKVKPWQLFYRRSRRRRTSLVQPQGLHHVGNQQPVHDEPRGVLDKQGRDSETRTVLVRRSVLNYSTSPCSTRAFFRALWWSSGGTRTSLGWSTTSRRPAGGWDFTDFQAWRDASVQNVVRETRTRKRSEATGWESGLTFR